MEEKINVSGKFKIISLKTYNEIILRGGHRKAQSKAFLVQREIIGNSKKISFSELYNSKGDAKDIYNNKNSKETPYQSLRNINTLLCLLFKKNIEVEKIRNFLNNFEIFEDSKSVELIDSFKLFIDLVKPHIGENYREYDFLIDIKTWKFKVVRIRNNNIELDNKSQNTSINNQQKTNTSEKENLKENFQKDDFIPITKHSISTYFFSIFSIPIAFFLFYLFYETFGLISDIIYFAILLFIAFIISLTFSIIGLLKKKNSIISKVLFSLGLIICFVYIIYQLIGVITLKNDSFNINFPDQGDYPFVEDPADRGYGIASIKLNFFDKELNVLDVNYMRETDTIYFYVSVAYQNATLNKLTNVHAKIHYSRTGNSNWTSFEGILYSDIGKTLIDETFISNLPNSWKIEPIEARAQNAHGDEECNESYNILLDIEKLTSIGVKLPDLDIKRKSSRNGYFGACSQATAIAKFRLIKL